MGDRANCVVKQNSYADNGEVFLYTHWSGYELPAIVQSALRKRWRWDDESYLTRIIFNEMTKGHESTETGFGISTVVGDNSYDYIVVDPKNQEVRFEDDDTRTANRKWTFEEFVADNFEAKWPDD